MGESLVRCREADVRVGEALVQDRKIGGRYQIVRLIGSGGMGRVYEALDTETGQSVAAKVLSVGEEVSLEMLLRFQQEGAVLATLQHPTIVEVLGTFMERHTSCIVMEFLDGLPLSDVLRGGRLSLARARRIAAQVADALAYAHSRAIVHRDVKPHNIMVLAGDRVKVTDFGIARVVREGATLNTATGMIIGTPHYMA
ncbi:MAG: serine/threonine protein kinase, partial [Chloroflexi bacterium]|nr:serine/threonine protein kinase [Chloroflexota bacterium]